MAGKPFMQRTAGGAATKQRLDRLACNLTVRIVPDVGHLFRLDYGDDFRDELASAM